MSGLTLEALRGLNTRQKLDLAGQFAGVPGNVMDGIWRTESTRGQNMVSPAGARGHFGIMPRERRVMSERLGFNIDPDNFDQALVASAHMMRENLNKFQNIPDALRAYNGGWTRGRWNNPETRAYAGKVLGTGDTEAMQPGRPRTQAPAANVLDLSKVDVDEFMDGKFKTPSLMSNGAPVTVDDILNAAPGDYADVPRPVSARRGSRFTRQSALMERMGGFQENATPQGQGMQELEGATELAREDARFQATRTPWTRFRAAQDQNTVDAAIMRNVDREVFKWDDNFDYSRDILGAGLEQGMSQREVREARETTRSLEHFQSLREEQQHRTQQQRIIGDGLGGFAYNLLGGTADVSGTLATLGVGKVLGAFNVGSTALRAAGRPVAAVTSTAAEGAVGNVAVTGLLDLSGEYVSPNEYAASFAFGGLIGTAVGGAQTALGRTRPVTEAMQELGTAAQMAADADIASAVAKAGPDADAATVARTATQMDNERAQGLISDVSAERSEWQLFTPEEAAAAPDANNMGRISDDTTAALADNFERNADRIVAANPIADDKGFGLLGRIGMASTGETLLSQLSNKAKALGLVLTEGTTGRGGRRHTAAMTLAMEERRFMRDVMDIESLEAIYTRENGMGWLQSHFTTEGERLRSAMNREIAVELRNRANPKGYVPSQSKSVVAMADRYAAGYKTMAEAQINAQTLGSANISVRPDYFPQQISAQKVMGLSDNHRAVLVNAIREQATGIFGWDKEFSEFFSKRYLEFARDRATGNYDVPVNLTNAQSSDLIKDILYKMRQGATDEQRIIIDGAEQKFARGGPAHTRRRTDFDVLHEYDDGAGGKVTMLDIMETDMMSLYRNYARRSAGELALNQFGIQGRHGLDVIRKALAVDLEKGNLTNDGMAAFDQIAAEFLNQPYGRSNNKYMDNLRILTSVAKLGGMAVTQFAEYGNALASLGVTRSFEAIKDLPRLMSEVKALRKGEEVPGILSSIEKVLGYELGLDSYILTRHFDVKDNDIQLYGRDGAGYGSKLIRGASHMQAIVSGHRVINAVQTRGMAEQITLKAMRFIREANDDVALADMGINPELSARIRAKLDKVATFDAKGEVTSLDLYAKGGLSAADRRDFSAAVVRGSAQIIQNTFVGETGKWAHNDFLKILTQFRTFSLTAVEKQWGRNLNNYGAVKSSMILFGAMGFAAPIHMVRVHAKTMGMKEEERKEYTEKYLSIPAIVQATLAYASAAGFAGDLWDMGGGAVSNIMGDAAPDIVQGTINPRGGSGTNNLLGQTVAPSIGMVESAWKVANGNWGEIKRLMPGANLPYVVPFVNAFEAATEED